MTEIDTGHGAPSSDDEFEQLARKAMAELKRPAPERGMAAVRSRGQRRQTTGTVAKVVGTLAVLVLGGVIVARAGGDDADRGPANPAITAAPATTVAPATTAVPTTAAAPATTAAVVIRPPILAGEAWIAVTRLTGDSSTGGERPEIVLVRPDGTGAHPLLGQLSGKHVEHSDWSPDGTRLLFDVRLPDDHLELWTANVDGTNAEVLVACADPCAEVGEASWSPDGTQVAFERFVRNGDGFISTLEVIDVATGESRVVVTAPPLGAYLAPRWSPDSTQLVFEVQTFSDERLEQLTTAALAIVEVTNPDGDLRVLTNTTDIASFPDWSPDGSLIVYTAEVPGKGGRDVYSIRPDGTGATRLSKFADQGAEVGRPRFTADGRHVVFSWVKANLPINEVVVLGLDGKYLPFGDPILGWDPQWRPGTPVG